jgi:phosphoglycerate dehydrogenase-like enzyme
VTATGDGPLLVVDLAAAAPVWNLPADAAARIRESAPPGWRVEVLCAPTVSDGDGGAPPSEEAMRAVAGAEAYFGYGIAPPLFAAARRLRWVHTAAAGVGSTLFPAMRASEVTVTNSAGIYAVPMAETVLGGLLWLLRGLDLAMGAQRRGAWDKAPFTGEGSPLREVAECRPLIVGTGGIGSELARRLTALGATCTGIRRRPALGAPEGFARVAPPDALDAELPLHDVLVLAAPATEETRELVTAARLDRLPWGAIVVNVARGALLDEDALAARVAAGRLRGAVLDVFRREPLPAESPLWGLASVVVTPHVSGVSPRAFWRRELDLFIDNWHRFARGEPMRNVVDKAAGY